MSLLGCCYSAGCKMWGRKVFVQIVTVIGGGYHYIADDRGTVCRRSFICYWEESLTSISTTPPIRNNSIWAELTQSVWLSQQLLSLSVPLHSLPLLPLPLFELWYLQIKSCNYKSWSLIKFIRLSPAAGRRRRSEDGCQPENCRV